MNVHLVSERGEHVGEGPAGAGADAWREPP